VFYRRKKETISTTLDLAAYKDIGLMIMKKIMTTLNSLVIPGKILDIWGYDVMQE